MKNIVLIILLYTSSCAKSQSGFLGFVEPTPPHALIIFAAESNSGGQALNSSALPEEIGTRSKVKILNNTSFVFEDLNIGVNNLIGHAGLEGGANTKHGWELGLANSADSGTLPNPTYLLKGGQGGCCVINWTSLAYSYLQIFYQRIDTAMILLTAINNGVAPQLYLFYNGAANDALNNNDTATWKADVKTFFANTRARYGSTMPIFFPYLPDIVGSPALNPDYNICITNLQNEVAELYPVSVIGATFIGGDVHHFDYEGEKLLAARMIATLKAHYTYY